ncbi:VaFE repeat-containing surface-anchored protein [Candidatus Saccharibacteria bacterium]|nr:VaFE repeat-containing surface-anchored protein [Candidatus Saccharibacteria bacterium]
MRKAFFAFLLISGLIAVVPGIVNRNNEDTSAISHTGDEVRIFYNPNDKIYYGEYADQEGNRGTTHFFDVITENSGTYDAYCANPSLKPLGGKYLVLRLGDDSEKFKLMKMAIFAGTGGGVNPSTTVAAEANNLLNRLFAGTGLSNDDRTHYAYIHALLGAIYANDYTGLNGHRAIVDGMIAKLRNEMSSATDAYVMAQAYSLYRVNRDQPVEFPAGYNVDNYDPDEFQDIVWIESPESGGFNIEKKDKGTSGDPQGNGNFAGIQFEVRAVGRIYRKDGTFFNDNDIVATGTTDAQGKVSFSDLPLGTYKVVESAGNDYYDVALPQTKTIYYEGHVDNLTFYDEIKKGSITVEKVDADSHDCRSLGSASLTSVTFSIVNRSAHSVIYGGSEIPVGSQLTTGTISAGRCNIAFNNLPYGTYEIIETAVGTGYSKTGPQTVTIPRDNNANITVTMANQVYRGNVKFKKVDKNDNNSAMANVAFSITSNTTGESHIVVTDSNGMVNTASIAHDRNTNKYDTINFTDVNAPRSYTYHNDWGTWFYGNASGLGNINNSLGALPYDDYTIKELLCTTNEFCYDANTWSMQFSISSNGQMVDLGNVAGTTNVQNDCVHHAISTTATDPVDGDKYIMVGEDVTVHDRVAYHAMRGKSYTIRGALYDRDSGAQLGVTQTDSFTIPTNGSEDGYRDLEFTFNSTEYAGHSIVVYEELIYDGRVVAEHKERTDDKQTVYVIDFGTTAVDKADEDKYVVARGEVQVQDTIDYCLIAGQTFTFVGNLYDVTAGSIIPNVTSSATVTPDATNNCSSVTIDFTLDSTGLAGHTIVVYEKLYHDNVEIMPHEDSTDEAQTVFFIDFGTTAVDDADGDKYVINAEDMTIEDTINYCLVAGQSFEFVAHLYDKTVGKLLVNSNGDIIEYSLEITPATACGAAVIDLDFNAKGLEGHDIVVFERLYHEDDLIMTHEDEEDEDQTVRIIGFGTTAIDQEDRDKYVIDGDMVTIRDRIKYCLVAGKTFTVDAYLVDKATEKPIEGGKDEIVSRTYTFVPQTDCGSFIATFKVNASKLAGHDLVAFERVLDNGVVVLTHEDIEDENETVRVISLQTFATSNQDELDELDEDSEIVITDLVKYCLKAGSEFTFVGKLFDKNSGQQLVINDKPIEQSYTFTPEEDCGEFELVYTFPAKGMAKKEFVILEELYDDFGRRILLREDLDNEDETVRLPDTGFMVETDGGAEGSSNPAMIALLGVLATATFVIVRGFAKTVVGAKRAF